MGVPSLREGSWKLISGEANDDFTKLPDNNKIKLYNIAEDPGKKIKVADKQLGRVARMM